LNINTATSIHTRAKYTRRNHTRPAHSERQNLALEQTSWVRPEIAEFVDFDTGFKAVDAFDVRKREAVCLEEPKAEKFVVEAETRVGHGGNELWKAKRRTQ